MAGEDAYRWGKREPITAEALTERFLGLHLRAQAMEALKVSYEEVLRTVSDRVLQRSEDVIAGLRGQLAQILQLEWLTALSTSLLTLVEGETRALVVLANQRPLFAPGPYAILTRTSTPDDYAIIRTLHYDRTLGQLDFEVVTRVGRPGPFADWQVAALAGSTLAQMSLLGVGKVARDAAVEANRLAQIAAGSADADAAATALDRIQTGLDRIGTSNDRAATLILRNQAVEAASSVDTTKFLQLDGLRPLTGRLQLAASAAGRAAFNLPAGTDPSAPAEGDIWYAGAGALRGYIAGAVHRVAWLGLDQSWNGQQTFNRPIRLAVGATSAFSADGELRVTAAGLFVRFGGAEQQIATAADLAAKPSLADVHALILAR